jgi:hypothetical protein
MKWAEVSRGQPETAGTARDWFENERAGLWAEIIASAGSDTPSSSDSGTTITVNRGCILIDDSPRCEGGDPYNVAATGEDTLSAVIDGKFTGDPAERSERPGCEMTASWSSSIAKLNYGADDCLYDANTQIQCCTEAIASGQTKTNPFFGGAPPQAALIAPSKTDGSIDCLDRTDASGTDTGSTFWTDATTFVFGERIRNDMIISTEDRSKCLESGVTTDDSGKKLSSYCVVSCQSKTCFVIADKVSDLGGVGSSSMSGSDLLTFAANSARQCPGTNKVTVAAGPGRAFDTALCMVAEGNGRICIPS